MQETTLPELTPSEQIMRPADICRALQCHPTTLWRRIRAKQFPPLIEIGPNARGLTRQAFNDWLASRPFHSVGAEQEAA